MWIYLVLGLLIGLVLASWLRRRSKAEPSQSDGLAALDAINRLRTRQKQQHLRQIMAMTNKNNRITNNLVEKRLKISDATASRYLSELEAAGQLVQGGSSSKTYYYRPASHDD